VRKNWAWETLLRQWALRDMVQNHALQLLLCAVGVEPPSALAADAIRDAQGLARAQTLDA
jgi:glucose-6-phosphate 1-dehydrogenase